MQRKFEFFFLEDARDFLAGLSEKARRKLIYNIDKSAYLNDPVLFKKLIREIWEFRTEYNGVKYRLLAFWDKSGKKETLVIATHGFIKKTDKTPGKEIVRAEKLKTAYFSAKK